MKDKENVVPLNNTTGEKRTGLLVESETEARIRSIIAELPTKFGLPLLQAFDRCRKIEVTLDTPATAPAGEPEA